MQLAAAGHKPDVSTNGGLPVLSGKLICPATFTHLFRQCLHAAVCKCNFINLEPTVVVWGFWPQTDRQNAPSKMRMCRNPAWQRFRPSCLLIFYALCQLHGADAQDDEAPAPVNVDALSEEELRRELRKVRQPSLFCGKYQARWATAHCHVLSTGASGHSNLPCFGVGPCNVIGFIYKLRCKGTCWADSRCNMLVTLEADLTCNTRCLFQQCAAYFVIQLGLTRTLFGCSIRLRSRMRAYARHSPGSTGGARRPSMHSWAAHVVEPRPTQIYPDAPVFQLLGVFT